MGHQVVQVIKFLGQDLIPSLDAVQPSHVSVRVIDAVGSLAAARRALWPAAVALSPSARSTPRPAWGHAGCGWLGPWTCVADTPDTPQRSVDAWTGWTTCWPAGGMSHDRSRRKKLLTAWAQSVAGDDPHASDGVFVIIRTTYGDDFRGEEVASRRIRPSLLILRRGCGIPYGKYIHRKGLDSYPPAHHDSSTAKTKGPVQVALRRRILANERITAQADRRTPLPRLPLPLR